MDVAEPLVVDLCSGSGAIALALAQELPRSTVHAFELDEGALTYTRRNIEASSDRARVTLHAGDATQAFADDRSWTAASTW